MMKYYVYKLIDPRNNLPFYVGKGSASRATWHITEIKAGRTTGNRYKDRIIKKLILLGNEPTIEYVYYTNDEEHAYDVEAMLIEEFGRRNIDQDGLLTNVCEDNRPPHGNYSNERREIYRKRMIGNTINKGRIQSTQEKEKRSRSLKAAYDSGNRIMSESTKQIIGKTHKGKVVSDETRQKISDAAIHRGEDPRKGKSYEELYGIERAQILLKNMSNRNQKEITVDTITYASIKKASIALGISEYKVKKRAT